MYERKNLRAAELKPDLVGPVRVWAVLLIPHKRRGEERRGEERRGEERRGEERRGKERRGEEKVSS